MTRVTDKFMSSLLSTMAGGVVEIPEDVGLSLGGVASGGVKATDLITEEDVAGAKVGGKSGGKGSKATKSGGGAGAAGKAAKPSAKGSR